MKQLRPVPIALAVLALSFFTWSTVTHACDQNKAKTTNASAASIQAGGASVCAGKASAKNAVFTAGNGAAQCPAQMAAGCTAAMAASCPMHGANATTISKNDMSAGCCMGKGTAASATAMNAGTEGCAAHAMKNTAMNAGAEGCAAHAMKNTAMNAGTEGCAAHMKTSAMAAGANGSCSMHGEKNSSMMSHADCDGCADFHDCDMKLKAMGAVLQVVPLKNGVMFVYTSDASKVRALQSAMAQRNDQMAMFASASSGAHLCEGCKQLRGAAMSGKLTREVVNIEGGCLSLMTSSDPAVVARIHAMAGVTAARAKI